MTPQNLSFFIWSVADLLRGDYKQVAHAGMAAMLGIEATVNQHVAYLKPSTNDLDVSDLLSVFDSAYLKLRRDSEEAGATKGAITCTQIGDLRIPLPHLLHIR